MAEEKKVDRAKLTITEISEPKPIGDKGAKKLMFKAKGEDGKELSYFTFSGRLFDYIKKGTAIEADVETSSREWDGKTYIDRKVTEIYIGGQPIAAQGRGGGRGWSSGKTPEDRASIEAQVAAKEVGACWREGKINDDDPLVKAYRRTILKWLDNVNLLPATTSKPTSKAEMPSDASGSPKMTTEATNEAQVSAGKVRAEDLPGAEEIKSLGDLFNACKSIGVSKAKALEFLTITDQKEIADVGEAWAEIVRQVAEESEAKA